MTEINPRISGPGPVVDEQVSFTVQAEQDLISAAAHLMQSTSELKSAIRRTIMYHGNGPAAKHQQYCRWHIPVSGVNVYYDKTSEGGCMVVMVALPMYRDQVLHGLLGGR